MLVIIDAILYELNRIGSDAEAERRTCKIRPINSRIVAQALKTHTGSVATKEALSIVNTTMSIFHKPHVRIIQIY